MCHKQNGRLLTYSPLHPSHSLAVQRRVLYNLYLKDISLCQINLNSFVQHNCCIALCHVASFSDSLVRCVVAPVLVPILAWPDLALWFLTLWFSWPSSSCFSTRVGALIGDYCDSSCSLEKLFTKEIIHIANFKKILRKKFFFSVLFEVEYGRYCSSSYYNFVNLCIIRLQVARYKECVFRNRGILNILVFIL